MSSRRCTRQVWGDGISKRTAQTLCCLDCCFVMPSICLLYLGIVHHAYPFLLCPPPCNARCCACSCCVPLPFTHACITPDCPLTLPLCLLLLRPPASPPCLPLSQYSPLTLHLSLLPLHPLPLPMPVTHSMLSFDAAPLLASAPTCPLPAPQWTLSSDTAALLALSATLCPFPQNAPQSTIL